MPKSRQYFRHSVSTNVAVVVIGFASFSASIVRAESITYNLIDYGNYDSNSYTLHGSITTDGVMGQLSATDITAWNINLEQAGSSAPLFPINPANTFVRAASGVVATAAGLELMSPPSTYSAPYVSYLIIDNQATNNQGPFIGLDWQIAWENPTSVNYATLGYSTNAIYQNSADVSQPTNTIYSPTDNPHNFLVATSVPEPSRIVAVLGLAGMGCVSLVWRRRRAAD
jgi:hypothetical protein